jgi:acetyl-CoA acetyltransferase
MAASLISFSQSRDMCAAAKSWAQGPTPHAALNKAGRSVDDLDLLKANQAFAARGPRFNTSKVNVKVSSAIRSRFGARTGDAAA